MKKIISVLLTLLATITFITSAYAYNPMIIATDYIDLSKENVAEDIQKLIDENPNRTIYFPDGVYRISRPIITPADPIKSVDIQLSNYAVLFASPDFIGDSVLILGGKYPANSNNIPGSNYSVSGGIIDCSGTTNGIRVESGRETKIQNVSIKNAVTGIHILYGVNNGSADCDVNGVSITGNNTLESTGIIIEGHDNTFTNIRISNVTTGVLVKASSNYLLNVHPLFNSDFKLYPYSCGFIDKNGNNTFTNCYSDQFRIGFKLSGGIISRFNECYCYWWTDKGKKETAFYSDGKFESTVRNLKVDFSISTNNTVLDGTRSGTGEFDNLIVEEARLNNNKAYKLFTEDSIIHKTRVFFKSISQVFIKIYRSFSK